MENDNNAKNIIKSIGIIFAIIVIGILGAVILAKQKTPEQKLAGSWKLVSISSGQGFEKPDYDFEVTFEKNGVCSINDTTDDSKYNKFKKMADDELYTIDEVEYTGKELKEMYQKQNKTGSYECDVTKNSISFSSKKDTYIYSYEIKDNILILKKDSKTLKLTRQ